MGDRNRLRASEQGQISQFRTSAVTLAWQKGSWCAEAWKEETLLLLDAILLP